jgi:hypothetical protein
MTEPRNLRTSRRPRAAGFTLIEILMSIVIFVTAGLGLLAFQEALMRSNTSANDVTAATYIGEFWLERGRLESLLWNNLGAGDLTAARTPLLAAVGANIAVPNSATGWLVLPAVGTTFGVGAPLNRYLETWPGPPGTTRDYAEFCVQYQVTVLWPNEILRLEVRVLWFKASAGLTRPTGAAAWTCPAAGMLTGANPDLQNVNMIQLASTLWRNQVGP